jgi:hypothetical protein
MINEEQMNAIIPDEKLINSGEYDLILIAENHRDDNTANKAMKILREKFDTTYFWCEDCDGLVTKKANCCLIKNNDDGYDTHTTIEF